MYCWNAKRGEHGKKKKGKKRLAYKKLYGFCVVDCNVSPSEFWKLTSPEFLALHKWVNPEKDMEWVDEIKEFMEKRKEKP